MFFSEFIDCTDKRAKLSACNGRDLFSRFFVYHFSGKRRGNFIQNDSARKGKVQICIGILDYYFHHVLYRFQKTALNLLHHNLNQVALSAFYFDKLSDKTVFHH